MERRADWHPWLDALRLHGSLASAQNQAQMDQSGVIWMKWTRMPSVHEDEEDEDDEEEGEAELAYEALELLALLSQIDQPKWRTLVQTIWPSASELWRGVSSSRCFQLGCTMDVWKLGIVGKWCERILLDDITCIVPPPYYVMRNELEHRLKHQDRTNTTRPVVPVRLGIEDQLHDDMDDLTPLLFEIVQLVGLQAAQDRIGVGYKSKWKRLFSIQGFALVGPFAHHSQRDFQYLRQIAAYGVRLSVLRLNSMDITQATAPVYVPTLQQLLDTGNSPTANECSAITPVNDAWIEQHASSQSYDGIFSAVRESSSLRMFSVYIRDTYVENGAFVRPANRRRLWQWIAAVFFSPQTSSLVDDLFLHAAEFTMRDAEIVEQTLLQADPMLALFPSWTRESSADPTVVMASTFRHSSPFAEDTHFTIDPAARSPLLTFESPVCNLRVINTLETEKDRDWLSVLLPGWGQAWVKRCDATVVTTPASEKPPGHPVRRVTIDSPASSDKEAVARMLRAAGSSFTSLTLDNWDEHEDPDISWLRSILRACPQLDTFELGCVPIQSLSMFTQLYEDASCRLSRLKLDGVRIRDIDTTTAPFFDALADDDHIMSQQLRELQIRTQPMARMPRGMAVAIGKMLTRNRRLCHLDVKLKVASVQIDRDDRDEIAALHKLQENYHGKPVAVRMRPLALEKKLAFLSAVWGHRHCHEPDDFGAAKSLDSSVVASIFEFAAQCRTRSVSVGVRLCHGRRVA